MTIRATVVSWSALHVLLLVQLRSEQALDPTFRSSAEVVRVYATVQDRSGHLVTDIRQDEFELRDRGKTVPLAVFSAAPQALSIAVMADMSGALFDQRTFGVLHEAFDAFVDRLGPDDRVSVGWFTKTNVVPGRDHLLDKNSMKAAFRTELTASRTMPGVSSRQNVMVISTAPTIRPVWNAIGKAIDSLRNAPGRKVVLVLTNGPDTGSLRGLPGHQEVRKMAQREDVMVYGVVGFEPRFADGVVKAQDQIVVLPPSITQVIDDTGGGLIDISRQRASPRMPLSNGVVAVLAGVADELKRQYMLGFVPTRRDGKVASIELKAKRPDAKVWARKSYVAPAE